MEQIRGQNENPEKQTGVLSQAVAKELGDIPKISITVEDLRELEQADRKKRNRRNAKFASVAAALILVCGTVVYAVWPNIAAPADADRNVERTVVEEYGDMIINENGSCGEGVVTRIERDWDKAVNMRDIFPDLMIPNYVPEGYKFVQLKVTHYIGLSYSAIYKYQKGNLELQIEEKFYLGRGEQASILAGSERQIETPKGIAYVSSKENEKVIVSILSSNSKIIIIGDLNEKEYIKIINEIDMP